MAFKKKIVFIPAWDKQNYGIHCVDCKFYLIGEKAVIQFTLFTGWYLPHTKNKINLSCLDYPFAADIGYHSAVPVFKGQSKMEYCEFFSNGCYYDGSSVQAEKYKDILISQGTKGLWKEMKIYYFENFKNEEEI